VNKKTKVLILADHPLSPSGVGTQTRYMIESLLKTGKYTFLCFGGAIKHDNYEPNTVDPWGKDWIIYPVNGYGNHEMIRSVMRTERPDVLWFMTDPRFFGWLWEIEDEIRPLVPMVYYHVWDNLPYPIYNKKYYDSTDAVVTISKVTNECVKNVSPGVDLFHIPHAVNNDIFKKLPIEDVDGFRKEHFKEEGQDRKFTFFWNNRNARRKQSGTVIFWFKEFLDKIGHENARLIMHTDVYDPHGQNLEMIIHELGLTDGQVIFSQQKLPFEGMSFLYNIADCTINISDAEGFGLSTLESLSCETPIIVNMTGGLQEQVTDGKDWFGVGIEPSSRAIIGSQEIPFIYEDRVNKNDFIDAMLEIYNMSEEERNELGRKGKEHVMKNYNFMHYGQKWDNLFQYIVKEYGSWPNKKYTRWKLSEVI